MFGPEFFKNALLVFTKFCQNENSIWERANGGKMTEDKAIEEYTNNFLDSF